MFEIRSFISKPWYSNDIANQVIQDLGLNERVRIASLPSSEIEILEAIRAYYIREKRSDTNDFCLS